MTTQEILEAARSAKTTLALADTATRDRALHGMADALCSADRLAAILEANAADLDAVRGQISEVMLDRLALSEVRVRAMADGIRERVRGSQKALSRDVTVIAAGIQDADGDRLCGAAGHAQKACQ